MSWMKAYGRARSFDGDAWSRARDLFVIFAGHGARALFERRGHTLSRGRHCLGVLAAFGLHNVDGLQISAPPFEICAEFAGRSAPDAVFHLQLTVAVLRQNRQTSGQSIAETHFAAFAVNREDAVLGAVKS